MRIKFNKKTIILIISIITSLIVLGSVSIIIIYSVMEKENRMMAKVKNSNAGEINQKLESDFFKQNPLLTDSTMLNSDKIDRNNNSPIPAKIRPLKKKKIDTIFSIVEEQPSFPGGDEARIRFLRENIKYPEEAKDLGIHGRVFSTFVVEIDGSLTDIRVIRGIGGGCDEEVLRVLKLMPKWKPGSQKGVPVRVQFNLPIIFTLQ